MGFLNWQLAALFSVSSFYARGKENILSNKTVVVELYVQRALVLIVYLFKKRHIAKAASLKTSQCCNRKGNLQPLWLHILRIVKVHLTTSFHSS